MIRNFLVDFFPAWFRIKITSDDVLPSLEEKKFTSSPTHRRKKPRKVDETTKEVVKN